MRVWMDRLLDYYLETGRGEQRERTRRAVLALREFTDFLDACVGGAGSIRSRFEAEGRILH